MAAPRRDDPFTNLERHVRFVVYRHLVDTARAPDVRTVAAALGVAEPEAIDALRRLAEAHALVLAPATQTIWMAHPFSAVPTIYPVEISGKTYYANCGWDVLGILSLLGDGVSHTVCDDCGASMSVSRSGHDMTGSGVVHFAVPPRRFWDNVAFT
jgi:hypothetical protein